MAPIIERGQDRKYRKCRTATPETPITDPAERAAEGHHQWRDRKCCPIQSLEQRGEDIEAVEVQQPDAPGVLPEQPTGSNPT